MKLQEDEKTFYGAYDRAGQGAHLKPKHVRQFTKDFVATSGFDPSMSVLELGCGNGLFLQFLAHLGCAEFQGVDGDPRVLAEIPPSLAPHVRIADFATFFTEISPGRNFDRIVLFDVLEHFAPEDGILLLRRCGAVLASGGKIVLRTPNMGSPFGLNVQYNDVTHRTCYTDGSLRQVARIAGFRLAWAGPQAYGSWFKEARERVLTRVLSWFLAAPPRIWSPNLVAVLEPESGGTDRP